MPRGKVPSLLSANNGGITFDTVKRGSNCSRCKSQLSQGTKVGQLKVMKAGFANYRRICIGCVQEIVGKSQEELDAIKAGAA